MHLRPLLPAAAATAAVGAVLVWGITVGRSLLDGLAPATCLATRCFCEAVRDEGLAQPVNTLTSLTYVLLGLWALLGGVDSPAKRPTTTPLMRAVGVALVLLGLGSAFYHGSLTFVGQVLDVQGMYLLGTLLVTGALLRRGRLSAAAAPWLLLGANVALLASQVVAPDSRRVLFAVVLLPGIVLEALPSTTGVPLWSRPLRPFLAGIGLLVLAYVAWLLDTAGVLCDPTSPFQGHGLWHVLTALAGVLVVAHYAATPGTSPSEASPPEASPAGEEWNNATQQQSGPGSPQV